MNFANALENNSRQTYTENGATAYNTTGSGLLDFFGTAGSLRKADKNRIERLFADAYTENPLLAAKTLFYTRDIRGGLGERNTFRILLSYAAMHHPEAIKPNIPLIGLYGRYDDLYVLIGTPLEKDMWEYMKAQLKTDEEAMKKGKTCSLLAKWMKTPDASSRKTREVGILTAKNLGLSVYDYKRKLRALRKYINVTEVHMSAKDWESIDYATVPSRAMTLYRKAFQRNDGQRYTEFLQAVAKGDAKVNASTLYPYDIIEKYTDTTDSFGWSIDLNVEYDELLEAQWKALPNYLDEEANAIVIADTSGSMHGRPMWSAIGLAIYFAERNKGAYHNLWMSFSRDSRVQKLKGETLAQKLASIDTVHWDGNTNLERAFMHILDIAIKNNVPAEEMVKSIIVISDMEIDFCSGNWSFYDEMRSRFMQYGYEIPNVVFWNVNSRNDVFHADKNRKGVQLCSGQSTATFKHLMASVGLTPTEMMLQVLNSERYAPVTIG